MDTGGDKGGEESGKPKRDEITQKDLQKYILAEIDELLKRERPNIVRRAQQKLRKDRGD